MSTVWTILAMGVGVYTLRPAGLALPDPAVPPAWDRPLGFLPVALLTRPGRVEPRRPGGRRPDPARRGHRGRARRLAHRADVGLHPERDGHLLVAETRVIRGLEWRR